MHQFNIKIPWVFSVINLCIGIMQCVYFEKDEEFRMSTFKDVYFPILPSCYHSARVSCPCEAVNLIFFILVPEL